MGRWMKAHADSVCQRCGAEADWRLRRYATDLFFCAPCRRAVLDERREERDTGGYVYALRVGPWIKIGTSYTPEKRMAAIDAVCPPSEGLYILNGGHALEKQLHDRLRAHRVKNEWFEASTAVLSALEEVWREQSGERTERDQDRQLRLV